MLIILDKYDKLKNHLIHAILNNLLSEPMYRFLSMAYLKVLEISLKFYSKIQSREIAKPSQLETFLSPTSQSKWPSRMNHPVDGIDPEGFHSACAYTCVLTVARFAGLACLRLSSANEFRFSATVGCHVKLYRRFFLSQPLPYVHMSPLRRVRGDAWSVSEKDYFFSLCVYPRVLAIIVRDC